MTDLVVGATGFIGRALIPRLVDSGTTVRAAARHPVVTAGATGAQWIACDLERPETLPPALAGVDTAYYLVHSLGRPDFRVIDRQCAESFAHAAAEAGCRRIIYLGGVAPRGRPSEHLASRLEVGEILRAGKVQAIELRAAIIIGNGSASWQILRDLAARLPFMVLPRWLESRSCPIAVEDVVTALVDAKDLPIDTSAWFDIPGPDVLSAREMLEIVAALDGRRIRSVRVPVLTPRLSAMWLKLVTRTNYSLARELVLGLGDDLLPESARYWELTQHPPRWSFHDAAARALATEPRVSRPARAIEQLVHRLGPHASEPPRATR